MSQATKTNEINRFNPKKAQYISAGILSLTGLILIISNKLMFIGIVSLLSGIVFLPQTFQLISWFSKTVFNPTKRIISRVFMVGLLLVSIIYSYNSKKKADLKTEADRHYREQTERGDSILNIAESEFVRDSVDKAIELAKLASSIYPDTLKNNAKNFLFEVRKYESDDFMKETFATMRVNNFEKLLAQGDKIDALAMPLYFSTQSVNDKFLKKLVDNTSIGISIQNKIKAEKAEAAAKVEREAKLAKIEADKARREAEKRRVEYERSTRVQYAKLLRNSYLDLGLDIKVRVSGKNKDRLTLTYVLFNDVWVRKLQTNGNPEEWHSMGFNRIDIKDGYDYYRYWTWK